jgi:hypothetical protein
MQRRILVWVAGLVGGTITLALISLMIVSRSAVQGAGAAAAADTLPPAGLPGTTDAPAPRRDTTVGAPRAPDPNQVQPNDGPLDSTLAALPLGQRRRTALDRVLRKGIVYEVKETTPNVIRYRVGAAFYSEPAKYRNPAVRDLYHAYLAGRTTSQPLYFEFWGQRWKYAEYVADTFYFGRRYAKPR